MLLEERRQDIIDKTIENGTVYITQLAKDYEVSTETIRKDLNYLAGLGKLTKIRGGAMTNQHATEYPYYNRQKENIELKKRIAIKATELIPQNSSIIIGSGSTNVEIAKLLVNRSDLKIFTGSLPVATILTPSANQVFIFGGRLRDLSSSVYGGWTIKAIKEISADIFFLGSDGFSNTHGPSSPSSSDTMINQIILKNVDKTYVVADYTKFDRKSLYTISSWADITALITNKEITDEDRLTIETDIITD